MTKKVSILIKDANTRKTFRIMKLITLFLAIGISISYAGNSYSQATTLSLKLKNRTVREVFTEIEKHSEYIFLYNRDTLDPERVVSINVKEETISEVLDKLFAGTDNIYKVSDRQVYISKAPKQENFTKEIQQQKRQVSGKVTDENGEPVIGANIMEKGTTNGTVTDIDGNFTLEVDENSSLQISYIGYLSVNINTSGKNKIDVTLQEDLKGLEEVVVVGYGTQKKANLTGSVVSVDLQEISKRKVGQTSMALQGIVPGLTVTQSSGQPGADGGTLRIRGITTLGENNPLILVDGVEMGINNIDPAMIESISVLKDAASAAIYGTRAANGVILITTKRAQADKFIVTYNGYMGFQQPTTLPKKVNAIDHMEMLSIAQKNAGTNPTFDDAYIQNYKNNMHIDPDAYPNVDWFNEVLTESGFSHNHFLTLSGGSNRIRTIVNIGYYDQNGIIPNTKYNRYTLRVNMDMDVSRKIATQIDAHLAMGKRKEPNQGVGSIVHYSFRTPAIFPMQFSNGDWGYAYNGLNARAMAIDGGLKHTENPSATLNLGLTYKPADWLVFQGNYNPNYYALFTSAFNKAITTFYSDGSQAFTQPTNSELTEKTDMGLTHLLTATGTASKSFHQNNFKLLLGYQQESTRVKWHSGYREGFQFPQYTVLNAGSEEIQKANGSESEIALRSYFGRLNYDYAGKYLLEANMRYDGTSRFAKANRWGFFPSFSAGWRVSEEDFWQTLVQTISNFKVRASWGELGNQNVGGYYPSYQTISMDFPYVSNNTVIDGAGISTLVNEELIWETTRMTGVGVDLGFGNKLDVVADYYYRKTHDILLRLDIPPTIGFGAPYQNAGVMENKGWDVSVTYRDNAGPFNYKMSFNLSDVQNKILDLKGQDQTSLIANREGHPFRSFYGFEADGYIQDSDYDTEGKYKHATQFAGFGRGDIKYKDQLTVDTDGDGIPDSGDGIINDADKVVIGSSIPRFTYGLNFYGEYKGFDLSFLIQGIGKLKGYLGGQAIQPFYVGGTALEMHKDYWTPENTEASFPRLYFNGTNNTQYSSFWLKDASYMRLKNLQIGYTLPQHFSKKMSINNIRVYANGDNLLTFDNFWDGYDVENTNNVTSAAYYPMVKNFTFGVEISF
ncbi:SusC/RagA family [Proteiniphilum saccharofermentans]|uniref:SusC/RagA family n=2 Tax=Proteiniphilum saccharofermentans TaxID=1642647 RepID=A0A1R3T5D0_9BACT|nr:SusC/RagA family [Proteiniphilum saccharofermentans]